MDRGPRDQLLMFQKVLVCWILHLSGDRSAMLYNDLRRSGCRTVAL